MIEIISKLNECSGLRTMFYGLVFILVVYGIIVATKEVLIAITEIFKK